ncbi:hypothetical protein [Sphingomonas crocodyli]|uniref:Uncharacterized protein n=1 Tax=Sphingomonas crocodyli TaxID=1979270 RepID=A0A437M0U6_9SPHN|nr:hypothetical protein [Sphingomonas crocodyli]RVT91307.1 hypothetical protein EOD43_17535 [Sphingomonas crocodyli]
MPRSLYRKLWRYNAFVVALCGTMGLGLLGFGAWQVIGRTPHLIEETARPTAFESANNLPSLSDAKIIGGTSLLAIKTQANDAAAYSEQQDRNVLLIDLRNGKSRYVLPDNKRKLVQWYILPASADDGNGVGRAYVALVGDDRPETTPRYDVLIGNVATGQQAWAARGVTALDAPELIDDNAIALLISNGNALSYHRYGLATLAREAVRPVAMIATAKPPQSR